VGGNRIRTEENPEIISKNSSSKTEIGTHITVYPFSLSTLGAMFDEAKVGCMATGLDAPSVKRVTKGDPEKLSITKIAQRRFLSLYSGILIMGVSLTSH
jgi:hypothetical protein